MRLIFVVSVLSFVIWTLWIRRHTWWVQFEAAATLNVALQSLKVILVWEPVSRWVSPKLHAATGQWNVEELVAHLAYVGGISAVLYMAVSRLDMSYPELRAFARRRIEIPALLFIPTVVLLFVVGDAGDRDRADLVTADWDSWLGLYFLLYCVAACYLLSQAAWVLWQLRIDPAQAKVVYSYLFAIGLSALSVAAIVYDVATDESPVIKWILIRAELVAYAGAAAYAWWARAKYLVGR